MAFRERTFRCSVCRSNLRTVGGRDHEFLQCPECAGGWVSHDTLARMFKVMRTDARVELLSRSRLGGPITVDIFRGTEAVGSSPLAGAITKIGRLPSSGIVLADVSVSRMHAVIENQNNVLSIIDLGSASGIYVNGDHTNRATLSAGDSVTIGAFRLEIVAGPHAPTTSQTCPECLGSLAPKSLEAVDVDVCEQHGVWFDATELAKILARVPRPSD